MDFSGVTAITLRINDWLYGTVLFCGHLDRKGEFQTVIESCKSMDCDNTHLESCLCVIILELYMQPHKN